MYITQPYDLHTAAHTMIYITSNAYGLRILKKSITFAWCNKMLKHIITNFRYTNYKNIKIPPHEKNTSTHYMHVRHFSFFTD